MTDPVHDITSFDEKLLYAATAPVYDQDPGRTLYWHVFGGPLADSTGGDSNFPTITYGPNPKAPDDQLRAMTLAGTEGETFRYLASFTHDPSDEDLRDLRPEEYK